VISQINIEQNLLEIAENVKVFFFWMSMEEAGVLKYLPSHHRRPLKVKETRR